MANLTLNMFRIAFSTLNFVSPSILADILLHPFDFATVLLQIGYNPEGIKYETATLVSVIVQYAIFTFYIPYVLTSMQGLQFMGMPHPSILSYVNYIYNKEGFLGCYRGLMPKICERLIMVGVNDRVKRSINKDTVRDPNQIQTESDQDAFLQNLINGVCSQFFAVLASHPFHVLMVSSFAEFTYNQKSSLLELSHSIYKGDGYFGFFTGLTARLLGELLSLIFSVTYTTIINTQMRPRYPVEENSEELSSQRTANIVNYVRDASRFTAFKQSKSVANEEIERMMVNEESEQNTLALQRIYHHYKALCNSLGNVTQSSFVQSSPIPSNSIPRDLGLRHCLLGPFEILRTKVGDEADKLKITLYFPLFGKKWYYIRSQPKYQFYHPDDFSYLTHTASLFVGFLLFPPPVKARKLQHFDAGIFIGTAQNINKIIEWDSRFLFQE